MRRRGVHASAEVFAETRIPVATVVRYLDNGFSDKRILASFPALYPEDIAAARAIGRVEPRDVLEAVGDRRDPATRAITGV